MKRYLLKKRYIVVVVPFYSWFNIYFSLFLRVVMSDNEYNQWKIKIKPTGIKLNHKIVIKTLCSFNVTNTFTCLQQAISKTGRLGVLLLSICSQCQKNVERFRKWRSKGKDDEWAGKRGKRTRINPGSRMLEYFVQLVSKKKFQVAHTIFMYKINKILRARWLIENYLS